MKAPDKLLLGVYSVAAFAIIVLMIALMVAYGPMWGVLLWAGLIGISWGLSAIHA
ncbi:MAG: hypothetical protein IPK72_08775 [Candidatus Eisenbacteria bacterium]|nr:hypothetical protein [Candidatus Eisenbacteria bacterium]